MVHQGSKRLLNKEEMRGGTFFTKTLALAHQQLFVVAIHLDVSTLPARHTLHFFLRHWSIDVFLVHVA